MRDPRYFLAWPGAGSHVFLRQSRRQLAQNPPPNPPKLRAIIEHCRRGRIAIIAAVVTIADANLIVVACDRCRGLFDLAVVAARAPDHYRGRYLDHALPARRCRDRPLLGRLIAAVGADRFCCRPWLPPPRSTFWPPLLPALALALLLGKSGEPIATQRAPSASINLLMMISFEAQTLGETSRSPPVHWRERSGEWCDLNRGAVVAPRSLVGTDTSRVSG